MRIKNWLSQHLTVKISPPAFAVRTLLLSSIFLGVTLSLPANAANEKQSAKVPADVEKSKPYQRWKWFFDQRAYPTGDIPAGANARALKQIKEAKEKTSKGARSGAVNGASAGVSSATFTAIAGDRWIPIGPKPIDSGIPSAGDWSGRIADIEVDRVATNHWFVAVATGGIWETWDAGNTWTAKSDNEATQMVSAIAMAPSNSNIVYAGTGDRFIGMSGLGEGLLKSMDGGDSWTLLTAAEISKTNFAEIRVHPTNPNTLLAATAATALSGILKSTDGGLTWRNLLSGLANDLEINPTNFDNQYASFLRTGIYRSTNAGEGWSLIDGPWSSSLAKIGRIEMAIAPSNPNVMYVSVGNIEIDRLLGIWRTDNAWAATPTWTQVVTVDANSTYSNQWWYNHDITVDPSDPFTAYFGGVQLHRTNGITTSYIGGNIHPDQQSLAWAGSRLIVGNDGGMYSSANPGAATPTWENLNAGLPTVMFYSGSLHPQNAGFALGGSQDNGTEKRSGTDRWQWIFGGDGAGNAFSDTNPDTHLAYSIQYLELWRTLDGGLSPQLSSTGIDSTGVPFIAPFEKCPANDNVFLGGTDNLWRSNDFFSSANNLPPLSTTPQWSANGPEMGQGITAIAFAAATGNCSTYAYASYDKLRLTTNGGGTWTDMDPGKSLPGLHITGIAFDPGNANIVYVTLSGYGADVGHFFKTTNALSASPMWTNVSPPVNIPHNTVLVDPNDSNTVYVGTDLGVWRSADAAATWTHMGLETGMPNVVVTDLQANKNTGKIVAFTFGRGAFMLAAPVDLVTTAVTVPRYVAAGALTTLSDTVCNQGYTATTGFDVHYYLSNDAQITTADTYIGTRTQASLAANSCISGNLTWTAVSGQPSHLPQHQINC